MSFVIPKICSDCLKKSSDRTTLWWVRWNEKLLWLAIAYSHDTIAGHCIGKIDKVDFN
ncbi:MAG: hypothetical protein N2235_06225 [Fischerella sp.]|nr:hypothetical protein [Fischerella sp.]